MGQHRPNIGPTWCQDGPNIAQHGPNLAQHKPKVSPRWLNIGPTWAQHALNIGPDCFHRSKPCHLGQHRPKIGPMAQHGPDLAQHMGTRWFNMSRTWPNMGTTCAQHRPRLLPYRQAVRIMPASVQHSPPWVCADNRGPIFPHHQPNVVAWPAPGCQA